MKLWYDNFKEGPKLGRGAKQVLWHEMSYQTYTEDSDNIEPEVWDKCYDPAPDEWMFWINEQ